MTTITQQDAYQVITADEVYADAFGIRYRGISPVQAAEINKIQATAKAAIWEISQLVSPAGEGTTVEPTIRGSHRDGIVAMSFGAKVSRKISVSEFTHQSEIFVTDAKMMVETVAAKSPDLVRERIIPSFNFGPDR